ncbi:MAG: methylamine utilization protein [Sulfurimonas sp.]|nr:MAG: methylamine utilization protein [Sulfurimonas sp.]
MKKIILLVSTLTWAASIHAAEHVIKQKDKTFAPETMKVKVGDKIIFKNNDGFAHNAFSDNEANEFDIGMQKPGQDVTIEMKKPGTVEVECAIHPNMHMTIEVVE